MTITNDIVCPVCGREMPYQFQEEHHLIPKSRGGRKGKTVTVCNICHDVIHRFFSPDKLKYRFNTVEKILAYPAMQAYIDWISRQSDNFGVVVRKATFRPVRPHKKLRPKRRMRPEKFIPYHRTYLNRSPLRTPLGLLIKDRK